MTGSVTVYIGLGSNRDRERHIRAGLEALSDRFGPLRISTVYESRAVGFDGTNFLNLVVGFQTPDSVATLSHFLKDVEFANGRAPDAAKFSPRSLDLDLLTHGDTAGTVAGVALPRAEILENAFVLRPLAELAPDDHHPVDGRSYRELWAAYDRGQALWPVSFTWRGELISQGESFATETHGKHGH
ncbi:2-amino-4-hydroxy-6-hydroxymethyldihydropteridine diphosphokinase [Tamilnaduibacter salinus]|uniref:2-amino-4-hydroxy-6-hydroxymethyldihydropteridine diphosphokinase n=1 Tax=Tamilnaduibacter salinus TaxID=1484056 RepID=A0A2U1CXR5_9GAMM|nr:2-amino-4-hydroxy-6-hydroxymethyldihydropteridine diphosphokinase [Tamilnaduibacter salinus]PVY77028.1 2-amino-4-hydroxy-6-hydroxymethyldihydropteridine diphosphokinase [Tamilnaduibacter salinus]